MPLTRVARTDHVETSGTDREAELEGGWDDAALQKRQLKHNTVNESHTQKQHSQCRW